MTDKERELNKFEETLIGDSSQIKAVIANAKKIAKSSTTTTLIIGESGTGKELVARLIHNLGTFANQPFVDINCGAIPETLLESELFGYEKGAFTDASEQKLGFFELANGGTIFLDEIGNTTANFQIKLLKAVEYKRFRRIGGTKEINISARIIAAANQDLLNLVKLGKFREDLYYRLNVFQIVIPPLRNRGEDSLILGQYFISHFNREYKRNIKGFTPATVNFFKTYKWPGNVRQLKNAIERAVLVNREEWIDKNDLHVDLGRKFAEHSKSDTEHGALSNHIFKSNGFEIPSEGFSFEEFERNVILSALKKANGNLSKAARLLKMNRGKFRYRIEKAGITLKDIYELKAQSLVNV